jgi:hypothetical protein
VAVPPVSRIDGFEGAVIQADVVDVNLGTRHNPQKLAAALLALESAPPNTISGLTHVFGTVMWKRLRPRQANSARGRR